MNKSNLKTILTAVKDMIKRNRVAYKDYLGEETVTETNVIAEGTTAGIGTLTLKDSSFTGFVEGETYDVTLNGETKQMTAADITYISAIVGGQ